jgi:hypothetical protein
MVKSHKRNDKHITRKNNRTKKKRRNRKTIGGKAYASGGYGCIFSPSLRCSKTDTKYRSNNVSKLMLSTYADREYTEIKRIKKILRDIPQHRELFLVYRELRVHVDHSLHCIGTWGDTKCQWAETPCAMGRGIHQQ